MTKTEITKKLLINSFMFQHRDFNEVVRSTNMCITLSEYLSNIKNSKLRKTIEDSIIDKVFNGTGTNFPVKSSTGVNMNLYVCNTKNKVFTCAITCIEII